MIEVGEYVSKKEYMKKYDSNVGYALHVQNSIKQDDYARLNTGKIVKVIGIKENNVNKKAIYYGFYNTDWFDSSAVENFSKDIIDLIEVGDYVNGKLIHKIDKGRNYCYLYYENFKRSRFTNNLIKYNGPIKKDRAEAEKDKQKYNISKGIYLQADKTIQLIKELYGGIC